MTVIKTVAVFTCFFALTKAASIDEILNNGTETETINIPLPSSTSELAEAEKFTLDKFRFKVGGLLQDEYENTDAYLLGWLLSTKWNIFSAEQMLRRSMQWKRVNKVAELAKAETPADLLERFPYRIDAKDKNGCPVFEIDIPKWDVSKFMLQHEFPRDAVAKFNKYIWQMYEKAERQLRKNAKQCPQYTLLIDFTDYSLDRISDFYSMSAISGLIRTYEKNYPGAMKVAYVINAQQDFRGTLEVFKPILSNLILSKTNVYFGEEEWKPILLSKIDAKELNYHYGGTKDAVFELL